MQHTVVSQDQWLAARKALLAKEKEFSRQRDELSRQRRELPWVKVDKSYAFDGPAGKETLADLFAGRSQLIVYHFMLGPGWKDGCPSCSFLADHFDGAAIHLAQRDVTLVVVSRAPLAEIEAYQKRMGWKFKWVSSYGSDFNFDYHLSFTKKELARSKVPYNYEMQEGNDGTTTDIRTSNQEELSNWEQMTEEKAGGKVEYNYSMTEFPSEEAPGLSAFIKNETGEVFHTYSAYARGLDILIGAYNFLDVAPKGRDENALPWSMAWVRRHDEYQTASQSCCHGAAKS